MTSRHDSRTILDQMGAESLLGRGDFYYSKPGYKNLIRGQSPFIEKEEIKKFIKLSQKV